MNEGDTVKPPPPSYRKPVSCIIGDAYTGKTMLLGCIRVVKESRICYFYCLSGSNTPLFTSLPTVNKLCRDLNMIFVHLCSSLMMIWTPTCNFHSLEAILKIMKTPQVNIPVSAVNIGPVHKKDVEKASAMLEKKPEYAVVLAFPAMVTPEAWQLAHKLGVKIFISDKMHHLFDRFKTYMNNIKEAQKKDSADEACVLKIKPNFVFNHKDPIVLGVDVLQGILKIGNPICIPSQKNIDIGRIASIENNLKPVDKAKKGQQVVIKIVGSSSEERQKMFGRHFWIDELVSHNTGVI